MGNREHAREVLGAARLCPSEIALAAPFHNSAHPSVRGACHACDMRNEVYYYLCVDPPLHGSSACVIGHRFAPVVPLATAVTCTASGASAVMWSAPNVLGMHLDVDHREDTARTPVTDSDAGRELVLVLGRQLRKISVSAGWTESG